MRLHSHSRAAPTQSRAAKSPLWGRQACLPPEAVTDGPPSPPFRSALAIGAELRGQLPRPSS
jgi:hypothetical protein